MKRETIMTSFKWKALLFYSIWPPVKLYYKYVMNKTQVCSYIILHIVCIIICAKSFLETLSTLECCEETRSLSPFTLLHISRKQPLHVMLSRRQTVWPFQIISTTCDPFSRTDSSQNKETPSQLIWAIFSISSQSGLSSAFRRLLLPGSLTAHIRLNKSSCQFLVSHIESSYWYIHIEKVLMNRLKLFWERLLDLLIDLITLHYPKYQWNLCICFFLLPSELVLKLSMVYCNYYNHSDCKHFLQSS